MLVMTYRVKRERVASTSPRAYMSGDASHDSQPTKKQANERTTSQVPTTTIKWGSFSPPAATKVKVLPPSLNTSTGAQIPVKENKVGAIWKNPTIGTSSSQKAPASTNNSHKAPSPKVPTSSTLPKAPANLKAPTLSSHKVAEKPSGYDDNGNFVYFSGSIQPIDVWSNNGVRFYVEFNELYQPIRKGGHILIGFLGNIAKIETYCPLGEEDFHAIDEHFKKKIINEMRDDAKAKVEQLRLINPSKSQLELEDEAFELTMHGGEIPDRPT
uniref:Uncharacterized protein n=1 Tax=Chenopodium quinoa TaxID=63459 RepID=A0A803L2S2_CHEQI